MNDEQPTKSSPHKSPANSSIPESVAVPTLPARFLVRKQIGAGSYGLVFLAWDSVLKRDVAIKVPQIQLELRDILLREAQAASRLKHPRIVRVYDVGEHDGRTYIVSDFIDGQTLGRWAADRQMSIDDLCGLMMKLAEAIEFAHQGGVIHRDLKPGNIMMDAAGDPHVLDFGLSHSRDQAFKSIAKMGSPVGTPAFMSPEQVQGQLDQIDTWTDVYALGVILYQLLTRTLPFSGASDSIYEEICQRSPLPPRQINRQIPAALEAIVLKAMAKKIGDRYQTAQALHDELDRFLSGRPVMAYRHFEPRVAKALARRYFLATLAGGLALGVGGLIWRLNQRAVADDRRVRVTIETDPPQAELTWLRLDSEKGKWVVVEDATCIAGAEVKLLPGVYKVQCRLRTEYFEVFRTVPVPTQTPVSVYLDLESPAHLNWEWSKDGHVARLSPVRILPADRVQVGMAFINGGELQVRNEVTLPLAFAGKHQRVGSFYVDCREVTTGEFLQALPGLAKRHPQDPDEPAKGVVYDHAVAFAERVGKNLPDAWELLYLTTNAGTTQYPWGDEITAQSSGELSQMLPDLDRNQNSPPVCGLFTIPAEWTETLYQPLFAESGELLVPANGNQRAVFGLKEYDDDLLQSIKQNYVRVTHEDCTAQKPYLGFRCVRRSGESGG